MIPPLTPAEIERLAVLSGELAEASAVVAKILRFGYENYHPNNPKITNRSLLEKEIGHVENAIHMLANHGDIDFRWVDESKLEKAASISAWLSKQD